jgi:hypothetical protein
MSRHPWLAHYLGDDAGRHETNEREDEVARAVGREWTLGHLWGLPRDAATVRAAVDFAFMMADKPAPPRIEEVLGPNVGTARGLREVCMYLGEGLGLVGGQDDRWFPMHEIQNTRGISDFLRRGLDNALWRLQSRGAGITEWLHDGVLVTRGDAARRAEQLGDAFGTAAFADFLCRSNLYSDAGAWAGMKALFFACGPFWWTDGTTFFHSRPPLHHAVDAGGVLHDETGPALVYEDGAMVHAWHGRGVSEELFVLRHELTVEMITAERNAERRRVMMEMFGVGDYVLAMGAKAVASDATGTLWRCELPGERHALQLVEVVNSTPEPDGTSKRYFLRVPWWLSTPRDAVAWTFGLSGDAYAPAIET